MDSQNQTTHWEGVRNYQARNFLRDQVKSGKQLLNLLPNVNLAKAYRQEQ